MKIEVRRAHWELRGIRVKPKTTLLLNIDRYSIRTRVLEVVGARLRPLDHNFFGFYSLLLEASVFSLAVCSAAKFICQDNNAYVSNSLKELGTLKR